MFGTSLIFNLIGRDGASPAFRTAGASAVGAAAKMEAASAKMRAAGALMTKSITLPVVAAAAASIKMASDFQESMEKLHGLVGISSHQVEAWGEDILEMSKRVAIAPKELSDAMFFITSSGLRGEVALDALNQAARASAAGLGETKTVADAVTSAMNAYGQENLSASRATDILTAAVRTGKLAAESLAPVIGKTLPIARAMGVSFEEVAGSMALMSRSGTNAATSATQVTAVIGSFAKPTLSMITALGKMHTNLDDVRKSLAEKGLVPTLAMLTANAKKFGIDISSVFGNKRALTGVLQLTGNLKTTNDVMKDVADSAGATDKAFKSAAETADFKFKTALTHLQVAFIKFGTVILPSVTKVVDKFTAALEWFDGQSTLFKQVTVGAVLFLAALGPLLSIAGRLIFVYQGFVKMLVLTGQMQRATTATTVTQTAAQKQATAATAAQSAATQGLSQKMAALRFGAGIAGIVAIGAASKTSSTEVKTFGTVAGGALLGFSLGGPIGAAIGGAAGALYTLTKGITAAADEAKGSRTEFMGMKDTLDSLTGAVTADTREFIANTLAHDGTLKSLAVYGITTRTAVSAILGESQARKVVTAAIQGQQTHYEGLIDQIRRLTAANVADAKAGTITPQAQAARKQQIDQLQAEADAEKRVIQSVRAGIGVTKQAIHQKRLDIAATADYTGKLKGLPRNVKTYISANGIIPTTKGIARIAQRYHLMPKQVKTLIAAAGIDTSVKAVARVRAKLMEVNKTKVDLSAYQQSLRAGSHTAEAGAREMGLAVLHKIEEGPKNAKADLSTFQKSITQAAISARGVASTGGHSVGSALQTGIIAGFAGTEAALSRQASAAVNSAIAAARHAADARSPSRKMAKLGHDLMDGLLQGIADRRFLVQKAIEAIQGVIDKVGNQISAAMNKVTNLQNVQRGFLNTFTQTSVFGTDLSTTTQDAEGNDVTHKATAADLIAFQKKQAQEARRLARDVKNVTGRGLSKALVRQLQASGTEGAATLHALAQGSKKDIDRLNRLNKQTSASLRAAGMRAGDYARGGSIEKDIRVAQQQERTLERQENILKRLEHHLQDIAHTQKKNQTITVQIDGEAVVSAVVRRNKRKGVKHAAGV